MKKFYYILIFLFLPGWVYSLPPQPPPSLGIVAYKDQKKHIEQIQIPEHGFTVYSSPKEDNKSGIIFSQDFVIFFKRSDLKKSLTDKWMIGYDSFALLVFESKAGFLRVTPKNSKLSLWIKNSEVENNGFVFFTWLNFLKTKKCCFFVTNPLNLREKPFRQSKQIYLMNSTNYDIAVTGNSNGNWLEVQVRKRKFPYCEGDESINEVKKGWIKAIDNSGFPNIYFYPKGC